MASIDCSFNLFLQEIAKDINFSSRHLCTGDVHCENNSDVPLTDEQRLYRKLRSNYDPSTRPVYNASHPVTVKIGITLTQIFDLVSGVHSSN